jgi:hypothetical protein
LVLLYKEKTLQELTLCIYPINHSDINSLFIVSIHVFFNFLNVLLNLFRVFIKTTRGGQVWWLIPVIPATHSGGSEGCEDPGLRPTQAKS